MKRRLEPLRGVGLCQSSTQLAVLDDGDAAGAHPVVDRLRDPVEVLPPERLVLAGVEEQGRADHGDGLVLGGAVRGLMPSHQGARRSASSGSWA